MIELSRTILGVDTDFVASCFGVCFRMGKLCRWGLWVCISWLDERERDERPFLIYFYRVPRKPEALR